MEITQHLQPSQGQFHFNQRCYAENAVARKAPSSGWVVEVQDSQPVSAVGLCVHAEPGNFKTCCGNLCEKVVRTSVYSFLESATALNQGLKEEFCVCIGPILIPAD